MMTQYVHLRQEAGNSMHFVLLSGRMFTFVDNGGTQIVILIKRLRSSPCENKGDWARDWICCWLNAYFYLRKNHAR
jgi:hypothetical protein